MKSLVGMFLVGLSGFLFSGCNRSNVPDTETWEDLTFIQAVEKAEKIVLFEGLPHPSYEQDLLKKERKSKQVIELKGHPFYSETLPVREKDRNSLVKLLKAESTYKDFSGEKKCGGFHPDYAVAVHVGNQVFHALICFGCKEAKLFGPNQEDRHDLERPAFKSLEAMLKTYQKNRPGNFRGA